MIYLDNMYFVIKNRQHKSFNEFIRKEWIRCNSKECDNNVENY